MKVLAIDYGTKNIGLALSDNEGRIAFAYATISGLSFRPTTSPQPSPCKGEGERFVPLPLIRGEMERGRGSLGMTNGVIEDIKKICGLEKVETVVVGMPIGLSGNDTEKTKEVWEFVKNLQENLEIPVETEDERLTTVAAGHLESAKGGKNARNVDELSAQILLQGFLDRQNLVGEK
jgi:putative Holliday junction resolvase